MGIKFKFKNNKAEQKLIYNRLNDMYCSINENKKQWVIDNIANKQFYEQELRIYNFFEEMKARKFYPVFKDRISVGKMVLAMKAFHKRCPDYEAFLFTDVKDVEKKFKVYIKSDIKNMNPDKDMAVLAFNQDYLALDLIDELNKYNIKYYAGDTIFSSCKVFPYR